MSGSRCSDERHHHRTGPRHRAKQAIETWLPPGAPDHRDDLPGAQVQIDALEHVGAVAIGEAHVPQLQVALGSVEDRVALGDGLVVVDDVEDLLQGGVGPLDDRQLGAELPHRLEQLVCALYNASRTASALLTSNAPGASTASLLTVPSSTIIA